MIAFRDLFQFGTQEEKPSKQYNLLDDFQFLGRSRSKEGFRAFLKNTVTGETRTVVEGDAIADYRIVEIDSALIRLDKNGEMFELKR